jgi:two-component sensor histidine kinase
VTLRMAEGRAILEVSDDGAGFAAGFDPQIEAKTGLELIENIAHFDLQGQIAYENREKGGARIVLTFPVSPRPCV